MSSKLLNRFNILLFILLVGINGWIYLHRDDGYAYTSCLNQNQLYGMSENPHITGFNLRGNDSLEIMIAPCKAQNNWVSVHESSKENKQNYQPIIKLQNGKHRYILHHGSDSIILGFDFVSSETYNKSGRTRGSVIELCYSSIPTSNAHFKSINEWQQSSPYTTELEIMEAKKLLKDSLHIKQTDKDIDKIEKISSYILKYTNAARGIPSDSMDLISPTKQFELVKSQKDKVWCGNFVDLFSFYTHCAGITTRLVCLEGSIGDVSKAGHSFNEAYIKELKQWVFVDLTSNSILAQSSNHQYLNSIELYHLYKLAPQEVTITRFLNDSIKKENFNSVKDFYDDYFQSNNQFVFYNRAQFENNTYNVLSKFKRYVSKKSTFSIYTEGKEITNEKFYWKQMALVSLICFSIYWLISSLFLKFKR